MLADRPAAGGECHLESESHRRVCMRLPRTRIFADGTKFSTTKFSTVDLFKQKKEKKELFTQPGHRKSKFGLGHGICTIPYYV